MTMRSRFLLGPLLALASLLGWPQQVGQARPVAIPVAQACAGVHQDVSRPLPDLGAAEYVRMDGQATGYLGGLYPDGSNVPPPAHAAAGLEAAAQIVPLSADGDPDPIAGRIVMISVGMSNTRIEFQAFIDLGYRDPDINPFLTIVNASQGGQTADLWVDPVASTWVEVDARLRQAGVTPMQVQVVWVKQTLPHGGDFPGKARRLQAALGDIVRNLKARYPNVRIVFLSSRTRSYLYDIGISPEPTAFETGFAVRWLIEDQINGDPSLNFDPGKGEVVAPFLAWGPYLWIDGMNPRSDALVWTPEDLIQDCTHPSPSGEVKVANLLMSFFKTDRLATGWFLARSAQPSPEPTQVPTEASTPRPARTTSPTPRPTATVSPRIIDDPTPGTRSAGTALIGGGVMVFALVAGHLLQRARRG
jgi:hypothetical protein